MDNNNITKPNEENVSNNESLPNTQSIDDGTANNTNTTASAPQQIIPQGNMPAGAYPVNPTYVKKPKEYFDIEKNDLIFALFSLITGILGVSLTLWGGFNIGFSISYIILFTLMTLYLSDKGNKIKAFPISCGVLSVCCCTIFAISGDFSVNFFSFIAVYMLAAVWFASLSGKFSDNGDFGLIKNVFSTTFKNGFCYQAKSVRSVFGKPGSKSRTSLKILIGIFTAVPFVIVATALLMKSDAAFEGLIEKSFGNAFEIICKIVLGIIVTPLLLSYGMGLKKNKNTPEKKSRFGGIDSIYIISFLSGIAAVYVIYLFSQLSYFFGAFKGFLPENYSFTVSEYARRGFFEMTAIALINLTVIYLAIILSKKDKKQDLAIRLISTFIGIFTVMISATALSKMILYIKSFGMTRLRILTSAFTVFVAIVVIAAIMRCYSKKVKVLRTALVTASIILIILGVGNVNSIIAKYNYESYVSGVLSELDVYEIDEQGFSGIPYLVKIADGNYKDYSKQAKECLSGKIEMMYINGYDYNTGVIPEKYKQNIGSYNYVRDNAYRVLDKYMKRHVQENKEQYLKDTKYISGTNTTSSNISD